MDHVQVGENSHGPSDRGHSFEVSVFILLLLPSMVVSHFAVNQPGLGFVVAAVGTILHNVGFVCLIAYFAWKNNERWERFGWTGRNASRELAVGVWLFVLMFLAASFVERALSYLGFSLPERSLPAFLTPRSSGARVLAFLLVVVVAISEEVIFRGYLPLRLGGVAKSRLCAVLLSTVIFASGHGYEGVSGVIGVFLIGLVLAAVYAWRKSLVAPMVMHFLQDFMGIFVLPLLSHGHG